MAAPFECKYWNLAISLQNHWKNYIKLIYTIFHENWAENGGLVRGVNLTPLAFHVSILTLALQGLNIREGSQKSLYSSTENQYFWLLESSTKSWWQSLQTYKIWIFKGASTIFYVCKFFHESSRDWLLI